VEHAPRATVAVHAGGGSIGEDQGELLGGFVPVEDLGPVVDLGGDRGEVVPVAGDLSALGEV